ncbi:MAG: RES domain-containing protein [Acidimicrobiales bacterium]
MPVGVPPADPALAVQVWKAGRRLLRVADDQFGATEFNPCLGEPSRFAPMVIDGQCVPTLYAAETLDAVLMESVFRDVVLERAEGPPEVYLADLATVRRSTITARRDLRLGRLDDDALEALGVPRAELIDTDADTYPDTVRWAVQAHGLGAADGQPLDGLIWHSRRAALGLRTRDLVLVLFGDRVARKDLRSIGTPVPLLTTGLSELDAVADRLGVTLVR